MKVVSIGPQRPSQSETINDAAEQIKTLIYANLKGLPLSVAVGVLEIVKFEIITAQPIE